MQLNKVGTEVTVFQATFLHFIRINYTQLFKPTLLGALESSGEAPNFSRLICLQLNLLCLFTLGKNTLKTTKVYRYIFKFLKFISAICRHYFVVNIHIFSCLSERNLKSGCFGFSYRSSSRKQPFDRRISPFRKR